jgi:predicted nucleic acid-binding protein
LSEYILDASVAAKWFLPSRREPLAAESLQLLERFAAGQVRLSVPDLFWPELGNVLWKSVRLERISEQSAFEAIEFLTRLNIPTVSSGAVISEALSLAITFQQTVYDCIYVALAVMRSQVLVTADERLANAMAARLPVRWLGALV